jgi:hypothetical protein
MFKKPSTDAHLVLFHWSAAAALALSLLTGLRIAADDAGARVSRWLAAIELQGSVHWLHFIAGLVLAYTAAGYFVYLKVTGLGGRLRLPAGKAVLAVRGGRQAWRVRNVLIYFWLFALVGVLALSGAAMYADWPPPARVPATWLANLHYATAWTLLGSVALHVVAQYQFGAAGARRGPSRVKAGVDWLLKMLRPRLAPRWGTTVRSAPSATALALGAAVTAGGGLLTLDRVTHATLAVRAVGEAEAPALDGRGDDPAWTTAGQTTVSTRNGANLPDGESLVEIQAVHDGADVYLKFAWRDPTRSLRHLPLLKTGSGWKLLHEQYDIEDEDLYYEDKFAVLLSRSPEPGGSGTAHLGPRPLPDKPPAFSGRGLHYTTDGTVADLWHWKAVRTGYLGSLGWADDGYFGPPADPKPEEVAGRSRYKAGYATDPGEAGYKNNFAHEGPGGYGRSVRPLRLPSDWQAVQGRLGRADVDPNRSDATPWSTVQDETVAYGPELDAAIPVGVAIPGVLLDGKKLTGDRADVRCAASWAEGRWTLECRRKLDTGSAYDLAFRPGETIYLWVSVFDHTQTRHSRHMRPIALRLEDGPAS